MMEATWQSETLKAPFVWFGGKRRVADLVWRELGDVDNYAEPFAGSLAVLLERPTWHNGDTETVNDADRYLANFWRALEHAPDDVAKWADWPVNECDLIARHLWLVNSGRERIASMESDPEFYDAKVAGWWVWGLNAWIGSGWCSGNGPWVIGANGIEDSRQLPHLGDRGRGVNRKLPHLGDRGRGVNRQLPHLGDRGRGVNRKLPHLGNRGQDKPGKETDVSSLILYFRELADRLRRVRVCCGDWARVVTNGALAYGDTVGIFLDPPYSGDVRQENLYATDDHDVAVAVRDWAIANGDNPRYRIVLCGYVDEHREAMPPNWREHRYSANKAYGTSSAVGSGRGNDANRHNECLWFSPHCRQEQTLFTEGD